MDDIRTVTIAVVIPCYRVAAEILDVIARIGPEVGWIYIVDDACPDHSGDVVMNACRDPRVQVLRHLTNQGVGAAVMTGYRAATKSPARIVVKLDGDGQMDPSLIPALCHLLLSGEADYVKGNRFYAISNVRQMPIVRLIGNAVLSFMTKLSSGYWQIFDPTNGFTAIRSEILHEINHLKIEPRYLFESDILYHLNQLHAVVAEMPMIAKYEDEKSSLSPLRMILPLIRKNASNTARRIFYSYFVRGFSVASVELILGLALLLFGVVFGLLKWRIAYIEGLPATAGTVMLAALPLIFGVQFVLSWLNYDVSAEPRIPIHKTMRN